MKKILFTLLLAIASLTSCDKISTHTNHAQTDNTNNCIEFNVSADKQTKAIVTGTAMVDNFGVYGYVQQSANVNNGTAGAYIMKNAEYSSDGTSTTKYYWPKADDNSDITVRFTAYSPYASSGPSISDDYLVIPVTATTMVQSTENDVLYATAESHPVFTHDSSVGGDDTRVPLHFTHALSWVEFQAKRDGASTVAVKITSIAFVDESGNAFTINTSGDFKINLTDGTTTWANTSGSNSLNFANHNNTALTTEYATLSESLLIPQTVPNKVVITFDVSCTGADDTIIYKGRQVTKTVNSGTDMADPANTYVGSWLAGKKYIYKIYVTADDIDFVVDIDDWTTTTFQTWDATAYAEHFFDKASTIQVQRMVDKEVLNSQMA